MFRIFRIYGIACLAVAALAGIIRAETVEFHVSQAWVELPEITVYLHVNDSEGKPVHDMEDGSLLARVGSHTPSVKGFKPFDPNREGVATIFLVDISKSLSKRQFKPIKEALSTWIDSMTEKDRASVMSFGTKVKSVQDFTSDKQALHAAVESLSPTDMDTRLHLGLVRAMEAGRRKDADLPTRRAIITLSDGRDDFAGGLTKEEVLMQMKEDPIPIYAIGFYRQPKTEKKESGLKLMGQFARTSGGNYFKAGKPASLHDIYQKVRQNIQNVWVATLACPTCNDDGAVSRLQVNLTSHGRTISDGIEIRMLPGIQLGATASGNAPTLSEEEADQSANEQNQPQAVPQEEAPQETDTVQTATPPAEETAQEVETDQVVPGEETPQEVETDQAAPGEETAQEVETDQAVPDNNTPQADSPTDESQTEPSASFWKNLPPWSYWVMGIAVPLFLWILIAAGRKKGSKNPADALPTETPEANTVVHAQPGDRQVASPPPSRQTGFKIRLVMMGRGSEERTHDLHITDSITIGRGKNGCDFSIGDDDEISGIHCRLQLSGKGVAVQDLNSTNGTLVNGIPITGPYQLQNGDTILIGRSEMRILF